MLRSFAIVLLTACALIAQSARSYSAGHPWWSAGDGAVLPWEETFDNSNGLLGVFNKDGAVRTAGHAFFERLGSNGRACVTCHQPSDAMSLSVASVRARWEETGGKDPVFAAVDGSNCPGLPQQLRESHSLLLDRGLIRIFIPRPATADFKIEVVRDPTGCNKSDSANISVYRRPRVAANFRYVPGDGFMSDGREPTLRAQALTAAMVHEQASAPPTAEQLRQILEFESQVYVAQGSDVRGGRLLGPANLARGVAGASRELFDGQRQPVESNLAGEFRASVARGSGLFYTRTFRVAGAASTCASCHDSEMSRWTDIGTANVGAPGRALPDLPLFRVSCDARVVYTQDPGRAMITGKCADVGAIAVHQLRGLAARTPYFSNGSARTLGEVVDFHDRRFGIGYSVSERQDLINFLTVL